jgi:DNA-binding NtrC family response regulator
MREDFFYRIRILPIQLPPLRERKEDIPLLIDHFLSRMTKDGGEHLYLPLHVRDAMENYEWPGNVRELQNVLHTYVTLGKLDLVGQVSMAPDGTPAELEPIDVNGAGLRQRMDAIEKQMIIQALEISRWHRGRTAELLKLNYKTLQRKIKAHGIK